MQSLFERLLGAQFHALPTPVQRLHALREPMTTAGRADVKAASNVLARLLCWGAGLPRPGTMDVSVSFAPCSEGEHWDRQFGDRRYASCICAGVGKDQNFLIERFGLFDLRFRLTARRRTRLVADRLAPHAHSVTRVSAHRMLGSCRRRAFHL
jgi:hypothetical protein